MVAIGALGLTLWALGLAVSTVLVVVVVLLAQRVVSELAQIRDYAADTLAHGVGLAGNLDPVPEVGRSRDLVRASVPVLARYADAVRRLLEAGP